MTSKPKRILVVDDEPQNLDLLEALLETFGYKVELASDGFQAIDRMGPLIDLVLLDVMMPGMDGFEVLQRIRDDPQCFDTPVIMVTSLTGKTDRLHAAELGANDFISKPIDRLELRVRMSSLLKMKEAQDEIKRHRAELEVMVEKRTEALRQSEEKYRALFEESLDPILMLDPRGNIVDVNRAFEGLFGYVLSEIANNPVHTLFAHTADGAGFEEELHRQGFVRDREITVRIKDGTERDCIFSLSARRSVHREILGYQSIVRDVTDSRRAHEALSQSEARTRLLIEASPIGIMIAQKGVYANVNPAFVSMFGYDSPEEVLDREVEDLCGLNSRSLYVEKMEQALQEKESIQQLELTGVKKDGRTLELAVWLRCTDIGTTPALLGFLVDISMERALREQLLQAQKMQALGTLAGGIAHDFNNILFAMMGFAELALDEIPQGTTIHSNLNQILVAGRRAKDLVRQILTFSRQTDEVKRPVQIAPIVKETLKFLRASLPTTVEIRHAIDPQLGTILARPTQIHQILMNLCTNAAHAMREKGGRLTVTLNQVELDSEPSPQLTGISPGRYLKLTVSDTGHGMSQEIADRIFEPYFTTKRAGEGTGLGLAVVHGIVESHEGRIEMQTRAKRGTTFSVYLPVIDEVSPNQADDGDIAPTGRETILVVDDEELLAAVTKQILESLGYRVAAETDSLEALDLFGSMPERFDLVITDMTMPNLTGIELAIKMKAVRPEVPVIVCTGFSDQISQDIAKDMGIEALVMKPVLKVELAKTVRRVLDRQ
jgi:two-component system, cell cycle sensor histidine kinase and response regulator CckA